MSKKLSIKEDEALAYIYDLPQYKIFKKYLENERFNIATKMLTLNPNESVEMARLQGQAYALKMVHQKLREVNRRIAKQP